MSVCRGASVSISSEISSLEPLPGRMNSAGIWQYSEIVYRSDEYSLSG